MAASGAAIVAGLIAFVIAVVLVLIGMVGVTSFHHGRCPSRLNSSPAAPIGPQCLQYPIVQGVND